MTVDHLEIVVSGLLIDLEEGNEVGSGDLEGADDFDWCKGDLLGLVGLQKGLGKGWLLLCD
jgi:hypothetical protein